MTPLPLNLLQVADFLRAAAGRCVLPVEQLPDGSLLAGPVLRPDLAGCPACYLARRRAAGWAGAADIFVPPGTLERLVGEAASDLHRLCHLMPDGHRRAEGFLPLPYCPCRKLRPRPPPAPRSAFGALGLHLGLVTAVSAEAMPGGWTAATARIALPSGDLLSGLAADRDEGRALRRALHEGLERYSLRSPPPAGVTVRAQRLHDGQAVAMPEGELWLTGEDSTSDGTALDADPRQAAVRAICERIERLAFAKTWALRPPLIRWTGDETEGVVPLTVAQGAFVALAYRQPGEGPPHLELGLGAALEAEEAMARAERERMLVGAAFRSGAARAIPPGARAVGPAHDVAFAEAALDPASARGVLTWLAAATPGPVPRTPLDPAQIAQAYPQAWLADITPPDVADLGLHAMRAGIFAPV